MQLYPAILTEDILLAQKQLDLAGTFTDCETVQIDLIDGFFADALTVTPADLATCEFGSLQCDLHIMAVDPEDVVNEAVEFAPLIPIRSITSQVEKMGDERSYVEAVRRQGWQVGLSLDVDTAIESIDESIWSQLQLVQVMGVPAGEQDQTFVKRTLELVDEIVQLRRAQDLQFELIVDGGIRPELLALLRAHHVDGCAVGSFIWNSETPDHQWHALQQ